MKLVIFNQDLRIYDNPALFFACKNLLENEQILPIFILDEVNKRVLGGASKWFLNFALENLQKQLEEKLGLNLLFFKNDTLKILPKLFSQFLVTEVYFNNLYEPFNVNLENEIKNLAAKENIKVLDFQSYLLFHPQNIKNKSGQYFKVFTPFWKECLRNWSLVSKPLGLPKIHFQSKNKKIKPVENVDLTELDLLPKNPNWSKSFSGLWYFDRETILKNLNEFFVNHIKNYKEDRNFPAKNSTSKISSLLHFGLLSVAEVIDLLKEYHQDNIQNKAGTAHFLSEIGWREFSHHLIYHFPAFPTQNFKTQFDKFVWKNDLKNLQQWQQGKTGYPLIDAAMQELWQTGFMQNRTRMIVASFLTKDLLIDWKFGEEWFWDCLVDANLANNVASWQWVAGSGVDAAPYFRIFNPDLQSKKFDPDGKYIKKWLPQLKNIPTKFIHQPWLLDKQDLEQYGVIIEENYPKRIVMHEEARNEALRLYKQVSVLQFTIRPTQK